MADRARDDAGDGEGTEAEERTDLSAGHRREHNIEIERNLKGEGRLARGDKTRFQKISFRAQGQARARRADPHFERLDRANEGAPTAPPPSPAAEGAANPSSPPAASGTLGRFFRRLKFWS